MKLLLIRHGETDHNAGRIALGRQDVPLNETGLAQAQALAAGVRAGRWPSEIRAVYTSPLQRTRATADAIAGALGLGVARVALDALVGLSPPNLPRVDEIGLDPRVLGFTAGLSVLSGLLFGAAPALGVGQAELKGDLASDRRRCGGC